MFAYIYQKCMQWSRHRHAPYYLFGVGFAESSFFVCPPDFMLIPMSMAKPDSALKFAMLTTIASTLGGMFGYLLGMLFFHLLYPWIVHFGYGPAYDQVNSWFHQYGFWAVFLAGFSPIPYKLFTIGAGAMRMTFFPFVIASLLGRGGRFFLVALLMRWGGERMEKAIHKYVNHIGWLTVAIVVVFYIGYRLLK